MRKMFASFATLAMLLGGAVGLASPTQAAAPKSELSVLKAFEDKMRANGTEAKVLAEAARSDSARSVAGPVKGQKKFVKAKSTKGKVSALTACTAPCYSYAGFGQDFTADPATSTSVVTMTGKPFVDSASYSPEHSLGELAVKSQDQLDIVEIGWTVDRTQRADGNPILFAFHWINGVPKGYNTAFVDYTDDPSTPAVEGAVNLGAGLPKPVAKHFGINQTATAFWVYYDSAPVAYVPKSRWTPMAVVRPFNAASAQFYVIQPFSEIGSNKAEPCSDMGTGQLWNASGTPTPPVTTWASYTVGGTVIAPNLATFQGDPGITGVFGSAQDTATSGRTGGPGYNSAGNGPGTINAC